MENNQKRAMRGELPAFRKVKKSYAAAFINGVLSSPRGASLLRLIEFDDHHFRAVFKASYFQLAEGASAPSKSQWNTLRKKIKRRNRRVFVYRESGAIACDDAPEGGCLYLDFGFFLW